MKSSIWRALTKTFINISRSIKNNQNKYIYLQDKVCIEEFQEWKLYQQQTLLEFIQSTTEKETAKKLEIPLLKLSFAKRTSLAISSNDLMSIMKKCFQTFDNNNNNLNLAFEMIRFLRSQVFDHIFFNK